MKGWLTRLRRHLQPVRSLPAESPRLPFDALEAERVFRRWDSLNGRYYFKADVRLDDGTLLQDMMFDGDTNIAVEFNRQWLYLQPQLLGRDIVAWLVTKDYTGGTRHGDATPAWRGGPSR
jgi:hypothetical protein